MTEASNRHGWTNEDGNGRSGTPLPPRYAKLIVAETMLCSAEGLREPSPDG